MFARQQLMYATKREKVLAVREKVPRGVSSSVVWGGGSESENVGEKPENAGNGGKVRVTTPDELSM